jgi:putative selenium metabolism hydrolase
MIAFCQRIVQIPSMPGEEGDVARAIQAEMQRLNYDEVWMDDWGNVVGLLRGRAAGPTLMFNGHMDHVDAGNPGDWPYPPFGGELHEGRLWGRGAADMKGPLAAMIHAVGMLAREAPTRSDPLRPPGDVYVAAVVQEETGGVGSTGLVESVRTDYGVVGEPSSNRLARGQRGRTELVVRASGRSVHASVPQQGVNPHAVLARFLQRLERLEMRHNDVFGAASVTPTLYRTDQASSNVVPSEAWVHLDWRTVPGETTQETIARIQPLLDACVAEVPGSGGEIAVERRQMQTHTGREVDVDLTLEPFLLERDDPLLARARQVLVRALDRPVEVIPWRFGTDSSRLMAGGIKTIGFGCSEAAPIHTVRESVPLDMLAEGMLAYAALALALGQEPDAEG